MGTTTGTRVLCTQYLLRVAINHPPPLKYKLALWEADVKKKGGNPGRHLGNVDLSSLDDTDDEEDSAEDSNSSDDGMRAIRDDLEKQRKVSSPSSPKENRFLAGFMKSSDKQSLDALAKQALDKDPISLFYPISLFNILQLAAGNHWTLDVDR